MLRVRVPETIDQLFLEIRVFLHLLEEVFFELVGRSHRNVQIPVGQIDDLRVDVLLRVLLGVSGRRERFERVVAIGHLEIGGAVLRALQLPGVHEEGGDQQSLGVGSGRLAEFVGDLDQDGRGGFEIFGPGEIVYTVRAGGASGQGEPCRGDQAYGGENSFTGLHAGARSGELPFRAEGGYASTGGTARVIHPVDMGVSGSTDS
ncbi:hypothetical protein [Nocardiopsis alba]|uniref:Uncharacterized protein n=1 Tax=Nocardiopsis alba (strain ATCC BAA-2165 / BE74) TaxID=1205910 RepID=J7KZM2_NOCAA|nr:hypothetical protein [Nocardiopsis alba]AFR05971.1 hypothetical protein B005_2928 [Nocardiopsis alba ATCC BAA-2165]